MRTDALRAFSPDADFLAIATSDGRVKTWDVLSGHMRGEFIDISASTVAAGSTPLGAANGHLAVNYTCIAWGSSKKGGRKGPKDAAPLILVLGTEAGDVMAWDTALGQLRWRANDCHSGGVSSIAVSKSGPIVYTAGADGMICELNIKSGELLGKFRAAKTPVSKVAVSPDGGSLMTASSELKLFDLSSKKRIRKLPGHPAAVVALAFSQDGKYVLSCATEERQVTVWRVEGQKSDTGAIFSLSMDHPAVAIGCSSVDQEQGILHVVALSENGGAYVWEASSIEELESVTPMTVSAATTKSSKSSKGTKDSVLAAHLVRGTGDDVERLLVARGTTAKPIFERVTIGAPGTSLVLDARSGGALLPGDHNFPNATTAGRRAEVTVIGPDGTPDTVISRPRVEFADGALPSQKMEKKRRASAGLDEGVEAAKPLDTVKSNDEAATAMEEDDGPTMEERLIALGIVDKAQSSETSEKPWIPRASSLNVLLSQALKADDTSLLERCLGVSDEKVIHDTIRSLKPSEAAKFLSLCIVRLETRPRRGIHLVPWVRSVLLLHAAALMSNPAIQPLLVSLYQLIEARLSIFQPLLALSGRLDLITAQISSTDAQVVSDPEAAAVVYTEEDSEPEPEVEEVQEESSSEDEKENLDVSSEDDSGEEA